MHDDVAGKINNDADVKKSTSNFIEKCAAQKSTNPITSQNIENNVKKSVQEFLNNPEFAQAHVDFCDSLIEHGCCLEEAIQKTDKIFGFLSQKETYQRN